MPTRRHFLGALTAPLVPSFQVQDRPFDLVIEGGRVLDGSGQSPVRADVAVSAGRIARVGDLRGTPAARRFDARGKFVAPGFIDVHSHAVEGLVRLGLEQGQPLLAQGITTIVGNPDGASPVDLATQQQTLERRGIGPNVALLVGHGSLRAHVVGLTDRPATAGELARMEALVDRAMSAGAFGLSSGLFYAPGSFAPTEELVALAKRVAPFGGVHSSHIRDEGSYGVGLLASVDEIIRIAEESSTVGIVSHLKALGRDVWGLGAQACRRIERARGRGVRVYADQYPYEASSTTLAAALLPRWAQDGGELAFTTRLEDPAFRDRLLAAMADNLRRRGGAGAIQIAYYRSDPGIEGRTLEAVAGARKLEPVRAALDLIERDSVGVVSFSMSERDIDVICRQTWTMTSSDGGLVAMNEGVPHPRNYGAFTRKLARYARDRRVLPLERAVRSMTALPAQVFGMTDRGRVAPGAAADLVVFELAALREAATYARPHQLAEGMALVLVNGIVVLEGGVFSDERPGRVLRRPPSRAA